MNVTHQNLAGNVSREDSGYLRSRDKASELSDLQRFRVVVLKLGGSLLDKPDLARRLNQLLTNPDQCCPGFMPSPDTRWLIISGGGAAADEIRRLDRLYHLPSSMTHWDAIAAMTFNAQLLARLIPALTLVKTAPEARIAWSSHRPAILDVHHYLKNEGQALAAELAESWDVTSDTIAAAIGKAWNCECLILAKSCDLPTPCTDWTAAAQLGLVDPAFPAAAQGLNVLWFNPGRSPL
jgi:aspartokinase-like uncharacterized kinase